MTLPRRTRARQRGFAIAGALFLIVILGVLGVSLSRITALNQSGSALDIQGARAYQAARAGTEWAAWQVLNPASAPACFAATTLAFTDGALQPFRVSITCKVVVTAETGVTLHAYRLVARACNHAPCDGVAPAPGLVDRQFELSVVRPADGQTGPFPVISRRERI